MTLTREALLQKAIENFRKAGNPAKIAECYEVWPKYLEAARIYEQEVLDFGRAARCFRQGREYRRAAELYERAELLAEAVECYKLANEFHKAGDLQATRLKDPKGAVQTYVQGACWYPAARLLDLTLNQPDKAQSCYRKCLEAIPAGPSARRAEALFGIAGIRHAKGDEAGREDFQEQGEGVADALSAAGRSAEAGSAYEAQGRYGVRAGRSHQVDAGFERALRNYSKGGDDAGYGRALAAYLEHARATGNLSLVDRLERMSGGPGGAAR